MDHDDAMRMLKAIATAFDEHDLDGITAPPPGLARHRAEPGSCAILPIGRWQAALTRSRHRPSA